MRFMGQQRLQAVVLKQTGRPFDFGSLITSPEDTVYVGLVGGRDPASIAIRQAQSFLRFDRRPSYFSQVFLFTGRGEGILECRVVGADPTRPESCGVIRDRARRYADPESWPNKAVVGFTFLPAEGGVEPKARVKKVLGAAGAASAVRDRYDLWEMIAGWQPYLFEPSRTANPLAGRLAHPGAAYVRYALGFAGIEAAPGALDQFDAPEHFWAAAYYWYRAYADPAVGVRVSLWRQIQDQSASVTVP